MYTTNVTNLDHILSSLPSYLQSARVRSDVFNLLRQIPSLQPNCGTFTHNDGSTSTLLSLCGTIPIFYRQNQYNIPVELWILEAYPAAPPVCFVRPTAGMIIKPDHPHVTSEGFVRISYLADWLQNNTLVELVAHLCSIFGAMPPVFRRPANQPQYFPPARQEYTPQQQAYNQPNANVGQSWQSPVVQEDPVVKKRKEATVKIQEALHELYQRIRDDIDTQFDHQLQLTQSNENVSKGIQSLHELTGDLDKAIQVIETQDQEATAWLDENEARDHVDPDAIIVTSDVVTKQLIDALAEHQAIEDALYFLDRALSNNHIQLPMFLKEVRKLARKQFMCQALMQKIIETQEHVYETPVLFGSPSTGTS